MSRTRVYFPLVVLTALLSGCGNLAYYAQAARGHLEVMRAARPIGEIVHDPAGDPELRRRLQEVMAVREFASRELGLPDNDSYRRYADLGRPYVVWNVFAAPELSLEPKRWCMLMVGCVSYRGYYAREDAERLAVELRAEGYDTHVGGVAAYSTLGWFADPVLNTFLRHGTLEVARTVFHELGHQLVFVKDDTTFNESFATTVENEGLRRWTIGPAAVAQRAAFEAQRARKAALVALIQEYRGKLRALYADQGPADQQRKAKADLLVALRRDFSALNPGWTGHAGHGKPVEADFNNARLASIGLYNELVPAFEALLREENHDLPRFYRRVRDLAALEESERRNALNRLHPVAAESMQATPSR